MVSESYGKETVDALVNGLRQEVRADINEAVGGLRTEIARVEGNLRTEIAREVGGLRAEMVAGFGAVNARLEGLRGEWRIWMIVFGAVLAVASSGVGNRVLNLVWPAGPALQPPAAGALVLP